MSLDPEDIFQVDVVGLGTLEDEMLCILEIK